MGDDHVNDIYECLRDPNRGVRITIFGKRQPEGGES